MSAKRVIAAVLHKIPENRDNCIAATASLTRATAAGHPPQDCTLHSAAHYKRTAAKRTAAQPQLQSAQPRNHSDK